MNTQDDSRLINAFVDDELDLTSRLDIEERMRLDAALAQKVEGLRQLREAIREGAVYHAAPAALRERMTRSMMPERATPGRAPAAVAAVIGRWLGWRPLAASFGLMAALVVTLNLAWLRSSQEERLLDDVVASHVRSTLGQHLVDVASSDHHTVKPWLSSKLDFSPPVSELRIADSVFLGGRVDYLDGHPVAALVYRQGAHVVNSFVWPASAKDSKPEFSQVRGFQTAHWSSNGMTHWVISDVNADEFSAVVGAIRSSEGNR
ncbi:MAG: anti-sigma factor family protein [Caldimonas sp.]